jgi:hypothetical protein
MVREGFPPISKPLPVLLQGPEYEDYPLVTRTNETSNFDKSSSSNWFFSFWTSILSAKWASNLLSITVAPESPAAIATTTALIYNSEPIEMSKPKPLLLDPRRAGSGKRP